MGDTFPFIFVFSFFHQRLTVFSVQIFHILGLIIPKYFIVFDTVVNGVISFSDVLLFVYRNETDIFVY